MTTTLTRLRSGRRAELALALAFAVGLLAATVHWTGLLVGGALVGILSVSTGRAAVLGFEFGLVILITYAFVLAWYGVLGAVFGAFPLSVGLVAVALGVPTVTAVVVRFGVDVDAGD